MRAIRSNVSIELDNNVVMTQMRLFMLGIFIIVFVIWEVFSLVSSVGFDIYLDLNLLEVHCFVLQDISMILLSLKMFCWVWIVFAESERVSAEFKKDFVEPEKEFWAT